MTKQPFEISLRNPERLGYYGRQLILQVCSKYLAESEIFTAMKDGKESVIITTTSNVRFIINRELHRIEQELTAEFLSCFYDFLKANGYFPAVALRKAS